MEWKYQYRVWNDHFDYIVTISIEKESYAINLAKGVAVDYYGLKEEHIQDVNVVFVTSFVHDSIINLKML